MDWPTFVVEFLKAIAWPGVALTTVLLLRRQLRLLLPLLTKLKYKDLELTFGRDAAEARAEAEQLPAPSGRIPVALPLSADVARLLPISPRSAVIEAWRELEYAARQAAMRREVLQPGLATIPPTKLANALASYQVLEPPQVGLFHDLRALRNQAAHAPEFALSEHAARDYVEAASRLVALLNSV